MLIASRVDAKATGRVEVVEVKGIIDGPVERAIASTIKQAEREHARLVVLQIDSKGVLGFTRFQRVIASIHRSRVPVAAWIGPPGAVAQNGAAVLVRASYLPAISPLSRLGPVSTIDMHVRGVDLINDVGRPRRLVRAASVPELLDILDGRSVEVRGRSLRLSTDPSESTIRFHDLDLLGRVLHAAAQPSITYLLLLLALVGLVFEAFHPSTGPAGLAGLAALALAIYGIVTLGGSWLGFGLVIGGVVAFAVDLRFQSLGVFTAIGFGALVAGSLLLFRSPFLRSSPWVLAIGIIGMVLFLLGAMTRVLRDLRAVARGELEVQDAHQHEGGH
jgi:membrane-bound ClpP family serine protease